MNRLLSSLCKAIPIIVIINVTNTTLENVTIMF